MARWEGRANVFQARGGWPRGAMDRSSPPVTATWPASTAPSAKSVPTAFRPFDFARANGSADLVAMAPAVAWRRPNGPTWWSTPNRFAEVIWAAWRGRLSGAPVRLSPPRDPDTADPGASPTPMCALHAVSGSCGTSGPPSGSILSSRGRPQWGFVRTTTLRSRRGNVPAAREQLGLPAEGFVVLVLRAVGPGDKRASPVLLGRLRGRAPEGDEAASCWSLAEPHVAHGERRSPSACVRNEAPHCVWLPARVDVVPLMHAADVVVVPRSVPKAFEGVAIEAMATGRPVVGSRIGDLPKSSTAIVERFLVEAARCPGSGRGPSSPGGVGTERTGPGEACRDMFHQQFSFEHDGRRDRAGPAIRRWRALIRYEFTPGSHHRTSLEARHSDRKPRKSVNFWTSDKSSEPSGPTWSWRSPCSWSALGGEWADAALPAQRIRASALILAIPALNDTASENISAIQIVIPQLVIEARATWCSPGRKKLVPSVVPPRLRQSHRHRRGGSNSLTIAAKERRILTARAYANAVSSPESPWRTSSRKDHSPCNNLGTSLADHARQPEKTAVLSSARSHSASFLHLARPGASSIRRRFRRSRGSCRVGMPVLPRCRA